MAYIKKIWKDYPDTTTKIKAEDLNNIENGIEELDTRLNDEEMYVQATAGANGDFFVNLTNQTLVNGRIVKISFPSSTNSSANARLSIDGGVTYKNIKYENGVQALASDIQSVDYELKYNGTDFITINSTPKVLYNNATGTTGNVPLSETSANFAYLEIFYMNNNNSFYDYSKVANPNGKLISLTSFENTTLRNSSYLISGTSMSFISGRFQELPTGTGLGGNYLKIIKVVGFR